MCPIIQAPSSFLPITHAPVPSGASSKMIGASFGHCAAVQKHSAFEMLRAGYGCAADVAAAAGIVGGGWLGLGGGEEDENSQVQGHGGYFEEAHRG